MSFLCQCFGEGRCRGGYYEAKSSLQENERCNMKGGDASRALEGELGAELKQLDCYGTGREDSYGSFGAEPYSPMVSSPQLCLPQPNVMSPGPFLKYDFADSRTIGTTLSSFTLDTIFEECPQCAERGSGGCCASCAAAACGVHMDFGSGVGVASVTLAPPGNLRCRAEASTGAGDLPALYGAYDSGTEARYFAILPSSTLSTVFEESVDEECGDGEYSGEQRQEEEQGDGVVPAAGCLHHSVTGGEPEAAAATTAATGLLRGLSAPETTLADGSVEAALQLHGHVHVPGRLGPVKEGMIPGPVKEGMIPGAWPSPRARGPPAVWYF